MNRIILILLILTSLLSCGRRSPRNTTSATYTRNRASKNSEEMVKLPSITNRSGNIAKSSRKVIAPTELFDRYNTAVFMIYTSDGVNGAQGSGFFISDNGLAVSNYHVFKGSTIGYETIKLVNNEQYKVKEIISYSNELDYILFKVDVGNRKVNHIPIAKDLPKVGEKAYAIGSPKGLENTFSSGEVSQIRDNHQIQISVPITHGSSGGALINSYGEVIGITTSGIEEGGANLNFAMSIQVIENI